MRLLTLALILALLLQSNATYNQLGKGSMQSGLIPTGTILFVDTGTCPTGYSELSSTGNYVLFTSSGNGDAGTTGGSLSYTPAGTNGKFLTPTGTNGTSTVTPLGTNNAPAISWPAGVPTFAGSAMGTHLHGAGTLADATSGSTIKLFTASASGVSAATLSGSTAAVSAGTPAGTVAWPAGVPTHAAATFTGSSSTVAAQTFTGNSGTVPAETWTGTPATIQPTFIRLIGCRKT